MKRNNIHAKDIANVLIQAKDVINLNQTYSDLMNEIEKILEYKIRWIIKKQKEYEDAPQEILKTASLPNSTLAYLQKL